MVPGVTPESIEEARRAFGLDFLFPYQRLVVHNTLSDDSTYNHQIVVLPTGAGKSLCFQIPALLLSGLTVVIYPLLSLMADQERRMRERGLSVAVLRGGQSRQERSRLFADLAAGRIQLLLTNPEALDHKEVLDALRPVTVDHAVIDEAHCLVQWGESFRPAYLTLKTTVPAIGPGRVTAFTATAGDATLGAIKRYLFPGGAHVVRADTDRTNIHYTVLPALVKNRTIADLIRRGPRPAIVFCRTRVETERTAIDLLLRSPELPVRFYHAGLERRQKAAIEEWFFQSPQGVLVSTCAYGMGVDKPDIRQVIHRTVPSTVEAFLQESGRAGRDRQRASSTVVYDSEDLAESEGDEQMRTYLTTPGCRRAFLAESMGTFLQRCTGCDRCDGAAEDVNPLVELLCQFLRHNPRRYRADEIPPALSRSAADWPDIEEGLRVLLSAGVVSAIPRGPWRNRLIVRRNRDHPSAVMTPPPRNPVNVQSVSLRKRAASAKVSG